MKINEIAQELSVTKGTFWNKDPSVTILFANTATAPTDEEWGNAIPLNPREKFPMGVPTGKIFVKTLRGEAELAISGFFSSNGELREQIQNCLVGTVVTQAEYDALGDVVLTNGVTYIVQG